MVNVIPTADVKPAIVKYYDVRDNRAFDMETLPDLLPEGLRPNDRYRGVRRSTSCVPEEQTKPFDPMQT